MRQHPTNSDASALAIAIVIHRVPGGLLVWRLTTKRLGTVSAVSALITMATAIGYISGPTELWPTQDAAMANLQAFIAGMIRHVLQGHSVTDHDSASSPPGTCNSAPCGDEHGHHHASLMTRSSVVEAIGFFVGIAITVGTTAIIHTNESPHAMGPSVLSP